MIKFILIIFYYLFFKKTKNLILEIYKFKIYILWKIIIIFLYIFENLNRYLTNLYNKNYKKIKLFYKMTSRPLVSV